LLGSRQPRLLSHPPYSETYGPEAVEYAAGGGLVADDWQADILNVLLAIRPDGKWSCADVGIVIPRQNGKGSCLEIRALAGMFLLGEELIMWSAHEYKTAMEGFRRLKAVVKSLGTQVGNNENLFNIDGSLVKFNNTNGEEGIERLDTEQRIRFVARSKGSGRGFSGDCVIIDEAYAYTLEQQDALMYTLSARPNPQIIYTSSPPLDAATGEPMFALKDRAEAGGDVALGWFDWGAPAGIDIDDRDEWAKSNPALGIRISLEAVENERRKDPAGDGFGRERLGIWPVRRKDALIKPEQWKSLVDVDSQAVDPVAFAVDITPMRDWASIVAYGLRADGLGHVVVVEHRPGTNWLRDRLVELRDRHNPVAICLDPAGPAANLLLDLEKVGIVRPEDPEKPELGDLAVPSGREYAGACGAFVDAVKNATLRHIDQAPLASAIDGVKTRPLGDAWAWGRRAGNVDISPLVAATLARWAFEARAHLINNDNYNILDSVL